MPTNAPQNPTQNQNQNQNQNKNATSRPGQNWQDEDNPNTDGNTENPSNIGEARSPGSVPGQQTGRGEQQQREPWKDAQTGAQTPGREDKQSSSSSSQSSRDDQEI